MPRLALGTFDDPRAPRIQGEGIDVLEAEHLPILWPALFRAGDLFTLDAAAIDPDLEPGRPLVRASVSWSVARRRLLDVWERVRSDAYGAVACAGIPALVDVLDADTVVLDAHAFDLDGEAGALESRLRSAISLVDAAASWSSELAQPFGSVRLTHALERDRTRICRWARRDTVRAAFYVWALGDAPDAVQAWLDQDDDVVELARTVEQECRDLLDALVAAGVVTGEPSAMGLRMLADAVRHRDPALVEARLELMVRWGQLQTGKGLTLWQRGLSIPGSLFRGAPSIGSVSLDADAIARAVESLGD